MRSPVYVEVGYLLAQLGDEDFPDGFFVELCDVSTEVLNNRKYVKELYIGNYI